MRVGFSAFGVAVDVTLQDKLGRSCAKLQSETVRLSFFELVGLSSPAPCLCFFVSMDETSVLLTNYHHQGLIVNRAHQHPDGRRPVHVAYCYRQR